MPKKSNKELIESFNSKGRLEAPLSMQRGFSFEARDANEEDRTIVLSYSSEEPVARWFGTEILSHDPDCPKLDRANQAGCLLFAHGRDPQFGVNPIGKIVRTWLDETDHRLYAEIQFAKDDKSNEIFQKVKDGICRSVSFGYSITKMERVKEGEKSSNGRFEGPCYVGTKWEVLEVSIEPIPADYTVGYGRSFAMDDFISEEEEKGGTNMDFEKLIAELTERMAKLESGSVETDAIRSQIKDLEEKLTVERKARIEAERVNEIVSICEKHGIDEDTRAKWVEEGLSVESVKSRVLDVISSQPVKTSSVEFLAEEGDKVRSAMTDGLCMRLGMNVEAPASGAENFRNFSLLRLAEEVAVRAGHKVRGYDPLTIAERAIFSTSDFPLLLQNVAKKRLGNAWNEQPVTFDQWAQKGTATDFKEQYIARLSEAAALVEVDENGEYKHAHFEEEGEHYSISTYGRTFSLSRQAVVNDDLNAFNRILRKFGAAARRKCNYLAYLQLTGNPTMSDGVTLFHADHGNLAADHIGVPSIDALDEVLVDMATQSGLLSETNSAEEAILGITPRFLVAPIGLRTATMTILGNTVYPGKYNSEINPMHNILTPIFEPMLDVIDSDAWYVIADKNSCDTVEYAYLSGNESPLLESWTEKAVDGVQFKVRIDFGAKALDWRGVYKNAGTSGE